MALSQAALSVSSTEQALQGRRASLGTVRSLFHDYGVVCCIFAGAHAEAIAKHRHSQDIDVWVTDEHIKTVPEILPQAERCHEFESTMYRLGTLEFMSRLVIYDSKRSYVFSLTPLAVKRLTFGGFGVPGLPFADWHDTLLLKMLLWRSPGSGKHDAYDAREIIRTQYEHGITIDYTYLSKRIAETDSWERVGPHMQELGIL